MKKINNLLIALLLSISLQLCGNLSKDELERYKVLVAHFDQDSKTFKQDQNFVLNEDDSRIIEKAKDQNQSSYYKWMPTILKTLSYGFGAQAFIDGLKTILYGINAPDSAFETLRTIAGPIRRYPLKPMSYTVETLNTPINEAIILALRRFHCRFYSCFHPFPYRIQHTTTTLSAGTIGLAIALYLSAKANELINQMNIDETMLNALNSDTNPSPSND